MFSNNGLHWCIFENVRPSLTANVECSFPFDLNRTHTGTYTTQPHFTSGNWVALRACGAMWFHSSTSMRQQWVFGIYFMRSKIVTHCDGFNSTRIFIAEFSTHSIPSGTNENSTGFVSCSTSTARVVGECVCWLLTMLRCRYGFFMSMLMTWNASAIYYFILDFWSHYTYTTLSDRANGREHEKSKMRS